MGGVARRSIAVAVLLASSVGCTELVGDDAGPGTTDAAVSDAGPTDAGASDAGGPDAGVDAGALDAGCMPGVFGTSTFDEACFQ